MPSSFFFNSVRFHQNSVFSEIRFPESFQPVSTVSKAIDDQREMECLFERQFLKSGFNLQRKFGAKANTIDVAAALVNSMSVQLEQGINMEMIAFTQDCKGVVRPDFEAIYLAGEELLSGEFTHVTTDELNQLKQTLNTILLQFEFYVVNNKKHEFYEYLRSRDMAVHCCQVVVQTQQLILSAKTVSAVIASIVTGFDVLAQMGLADNDSVANVFKKELPDALGLEIKKMNLNTTLNPSGSAFQFGQARELLIKKLETYLSRRASLTSQFVAGGEVRKQYESIDRGFFYNRELQQARIVIAANLLTQLQFERNEDGTRLSNPQVFAKLLMDAIDANEQCYRQHARCVDGTGELAEYLDSMRKEMGRLYTQEIYSEANGEQVDLHEQLRLGQASSSQFTT